MNSNCTVCGHHIADNHDFGTSVFEADDVPCTGCIGGWCQIPPRVA